MKKYTPEQIIELAKEVEMLDGIDWADLPINKDHVYQLIGSQVCEVFEHIANEEDGEAILLATVTKLVVENFVLNLQVNSI